MFSTFCKKDSWQKMLVVVLLMTMLFSAIAPTAYADENGGTVTIGGEDTPDGGDGGDTGDGGDGDENSDGAPAEALPIVSENFPEGESGEGAPGEDGTGGDQGTGGDEGGEGESGANEDVTGQLTEVGTTTATIDTGDATATGEISTTANSNSVRSVPDALGQETDTYTVNATGTNDTLVDNTGTTTAVTGENVASSTDNAFITTGDAFSVLNIANVLNTNIINSSGFMSLLNKILGDEGILDLRELFFSNPEAVLEASNQCSLMSCAAEDVIYNLLQRNQATINNDVDIFAITGDNEAVGDIASISTGDAYGAANIINVANTNIIDSNYILMAVNGMGTLNGDLILPSADLWYAFFGRPNGLTQVEDAEDGVLVDENINHAEVSNDIETMAESGMNQSTTTLAESYTTTGIAEAASNIVNTVNQNFFGGDSMYMLIKVHGAWNGSVYGLPQGLSWELTPEGIVIYNSDAEITPSELLMCGSKFCDVDSYRANLQNHSTSTINNEVDIVALTGENVLEGDIGLMSTGDAYAGANVMNIANTNVIGRNWVMAVLNIFGDFNGSVSFGAPDLWIGGQLQADTDSVGPGSKVTYTYTIENKGDMPAEDVEFTHEFDSAFMYHSVNGQLANSLETASLGDIAPGETKTVTFEGVIGQDLPTGTTTVRAVAEVRSVRSDSNPEDNTEELEVDATRPEDTEPATGSGDTGTNDPGSETNESGNETPSRGGGGSSSPTKQVLGASVERGKVKADPNAAPQVVVYKTVLNDDKVAVRAGDSVDYLVTVKNRGGTAYNARVIDTLLNPIGTVVSEQSWDLGNILPGEVIELTYTINYKSDTPSGEYVNKASVVAYRAPKPDGKPGKQLKIRDATHKLQIEGVGLAVRNSRFLGSFPTNNGTYIAVVAWDTNLPADGQLFWSEKSKASAYNPLVPNLGYQNASLYFPFPRTQHFLFMGNLRPGTEYTYRIRSSGRGLSSTGGDYTFSIPGVSPIAAASAASPAAAVETTTDR